MYCFDGGFRTDNYQTYLANCTVMICLTHCNFAFGESPPIRSVESPDKQHFVHIVVQKNGAHCGDSLLEFVEVGVDAVQQVLERTQPGAVTKE